MGIWSRRVVPACGNLCVFCPSLRARSRQPVKRYKKLLADIFPRNQEAEPNDRLIGKLCEYASKNPLRIPKITEQLEQKCYKDLRNEKFGSVKVVLCIFRKLLSTCKEQMPLFANSLLGIVRTLFEQTRHDEMVILGCSTLVDFISSQMDSAYTFNLEGLIPKLCQFAREAGDDERALRLRSAGMQALVFMVRFMGEHSNMSMDIDAIISVTMENYIDLGRNSKNANDESQYSQIEDKRIEGKHKDEGNGLSIPDTIQKVPSVPNIGNAYSESTMDTSKNPSYWSRALLSNLARLAKEATTVRRVIEPLFHTFDTENYWSMKSGVACSVLMYLQSLLEESGENSHLLLSILVKHLDHKLVAKQPLLQIDIVDITIQLARNVQKQASVAIIAAIADLIKHLRKCMLNSAELASPHDEMEKWNSELQKGLENCIAQLSNKVGDAGPILDKLAVVMENISTNTVVARTTISSVHRTAKIISSIPNILYHKKAFPDALFHHLLVAMSHPDHETRIGAHSIFSIVLMPSLLSPWSGQDMTTEAVPGTLSVNPSQKARSGSFSLKGDFKDKSELMDGVREEGRRLHTSTRQNTVSRSRGQSYSFMHALADGKSLSSLRLSSHQVSLLLSSMWVQATYAENTPANFEAMAHSYSITVLLTRTKSSNHVALARCLQMALSLRSIALDPEGNLQPSHRRSIFTLASYMLIFSAKAGNIPELVPTVKASLSDVTGDPYLELIEDIRLQAVHVGSDKALAYGSEDDDIAALNFLSTIESDDHQLKEIVITHFLTKYGNLSEDEQLDIQKKIHQAFLPDDTYPLGAPLFMDTPRPGSPFARLESQSFEEVMPAALLSDEEASSDPTGSQSSRKTSLPINTVDILSVNELMESVLETASQVASLPASSTPIPYDQMKNQCEALVTGKHEKMSVLQSFKQQQEAKALVVFGETEKTDTSSLDMDHKVSEDDLKIVTSDEVRLSSDEVSLWSYGRGKNSFRLPPSSPYDKFLKAAGC